MCGREAPVAGRATGVVERPALFGRLSAGVADGVTLLSAAAGSGKTTLLRSWLEDAGGRTRTAWVTVDHDERDAQAFWLSVVEQLRRAAGGEGTIGELSPALTFDGKSVVQRLISELDSLDEPVILVVDDLHELVSPDAQAQLEMLLARRPASSAGTASAAADGSAHRAAQRRSSLHRWRSAGAVRRLGTDDRG